MTNKTFTAIAFVTSLLASAQVVAQERYVDHTSGLTLTYRCYHAATAAGMTLDADALLRKGDYEALRRGLSVGQVGEVKGYSRRWSEDDFKTYGNPMAAFNMLGCRTISQSRIVHENPNQRIPPGAEKR